jgi:hypothetical protein
VVVRIEDDDSVASLYSGGFTYDPDRPEGLERFKQFAVAQELLLAVAAANNLKVIFVVSVTQYHINVDDNFGHTVGYPGAYDFYNSVVNPTTHGIGNLWTTKLQSVLNIPDRQVHSFIGDDRIAGWVMQGEWNPTVPAQVDYLNKYWQHFYNLVHYGGASSSWVSLWAISGPDRGLPEALGHIEALKDYLAQQPVKPDMFGIEWYGNADYDLSNIDADLAYMIQSAQYHGYYVPPSQIMLLEGGTNQSANPELAPFLSNAISRAAGSGGLGPVTAGIAVWMTDSAEQHNDVPGCNIDSNPAGGQFAFSLVNVTYTSVSDAFASH